MTDNVFMSDEFDDTSVPDYTKDAITNAKSKPTSFWDEVGNYFSQPGEPRPFSGKQVGLGMAIGAPIAVATGVGVPLAIGASALASTTGEYMRSRGSSEGAAIAGEMIAGGIPAIGKMAVPVVKAFKYGAGRLLELPTKTAEDKALITVKEKLLGKDMFKVLSTTENTDATREALIKQYNLQGIGADEKASSVLRTQMYDDVKGLDTFSKSPEFKELLDDLQALKQRDRVSSKELSSLVRIVNNDKSTNPKVQPEATKDLINLIQNGGTFVREGVTQKKIPEEAQKALREKFNLYLHRNLGDEKYNTLKSVEKQEFIAEARDAVPTLIDRGFKLPKDDMDRMTSLLSQSIEGKTEFVGAFNQYLKGIDNPTTMKSEFNRLRRDIERTGIMNREELVAISEKINNLPKLAEKERLKEMMYSLIMAPITASIGSQAGQITKKVNPFGVYSL